MCARKPQGCRMTILTPFVKTISAGSLDLGLCRASQHSSQIANVKVFPEFVFDPACGVTKAYVPLVSKIADALVVQATLNLVV